MDLGAHVGEWTVMAAALWPEATVYAFEPYEPAFHFLEINCAPYKNVKLFNAAAAHVNGTVQFNIDSFGSLCHSVYDRGRVVKTVEVEAVSYKDIAGLNPDIVKCDIEGPECEFLHGFSAALPVERVKRFYFEFHSEANRRSIERQLILTHELAYARITQTQQGEVMYLRRTT